MEKYHEHKDGDDFKLVVDIGEFEVARKYAFRAYPQTVMAELRLYSSVIGSPVEIRVSAREGRELSHALFIDGTNRNTSDKARDNLNFIVGFAMGCRHERMKSP